MKCTKCRTSQTRHTLMLLALMMCVSVVATVNADAVSSGSDQAENDETRALYNDIDIALAAHASGDAQGAIQLWRDISTRAPGVSTPLANIALLQMQLGQLEEAERSLLQAISSRPRAAYYNQLGVVQRKSGKFAAAKKSYLDALSLDENYAKAHLNLGILCDLYLDDANAALQHYRRYQELSTDGHKELSNWIGDLERRVKVMQ